MEKLNTKNKLSIPNNNINSSSFQSNLGGILHDCQLKYPTPTQHILKMLSENEDEYIYHTQLFLEYDNENAFIFILKKCIVFTHLLPEDISSLGCESDLILYIIKFSQIYCFELDVNEIDGNHILLQFYDNDYSKKSELKLKFSFLKDSYFVHHFIKKCFISYWQRVFEESVISEYTTQIYHYHFFVKKLNRWGTMQDRILMITNKVKVLLMIKLVVYSQHQAYLQEKSPEICK